MAPTTSPSESKASDLQSLGIWLESLSRYCGPKVSRTLTISAVSASWEKLGDAGFALAHSFYRAELDPVPGATLRLEKYGMLLEGEKKALFNSSHDGHWKFSAALAEAAELGKQAAREGWEEAELDVKLEAWLAARLAKSLVKSALKKTDLRR